MGFKKTYLSSGSSSVIHNFLLAIRSVASGALDKVSRTARQMFQDALFAIAFTCHKKELYLLLGWSSLF